MTIGKRIKQLREGKKLTQEELAQKLSTTKQTIYKYENEIVTNIPLERIEMLARALGSTPVYLMGWEDNANTTAKDQYFCHSYPIIGEVAAGFGCDAIEEETGEYEDIPISWIRGHKQDSFFVLRVKGDSMYPNYQDGDRVLVKRQTSVDSGSIAVVLYDGEMATLKKVNYVSGEDWMVLEPLNREYAPKRIEGQSLAQCRVLGEVRRLIRVVK